MTTPNNILERAVSIRRSPRAVEDLEDDGGDDESKTRKHTSIATGVTSYLTVTGYLWPILIIGLVVIISSLIIHSRDLICISASSSDHISRLSFFRFDALESDFGSLGVPWCRSKRGKTVEWTSKDLLEGLEEFVPVYETRPIKNNMYGMGFDHSFGLWFMTRWLKPELMIESGAFKGHSTWVLRQAMPNTPIVSLSPRHPEKYLKKGPAYVDGNCTYFSGKEFVDFGSIDWGRVMRKHGIKDITRVLVFFDDHQNELKRLKQALKAGFKHLVFEDNYDTGTGDHYSLRQICDQFYIRGGGHSCYKDGDEDRVRSRRKKLWEKAVDTEELCGPGEAWWGVRGEMRDNFNHSNKVITYSQHFQNSRFVESVLDIYWELPPVAGPSLTHQTRGGLGSGGEEERYGASLFQQQKKLDTNWEDQELNLNPPLSFTRIIINNNNNHVVDDVKQEVSQSTSSQLYGHQLDQFQDEFHPNNIIRPSNNSWIHHYQVIPVSSPTSCITTLSNNNFLNFSSTKAAATVEVKSNHERHEDRISEGNSRSTGGVSKKARVQQSSAQPALQVRKEKLGDRITALHQLVSPFGKTDTASVLSEAIGYIRFLQAQIEALSTPYMRNASGSTGSHQHSVQERNCLFPEELSQDSQGVMDLKSRGLCLVPISCTQHVGNDTGADYWAPAALGGGF